MFYWPRYPRKARIILSSHVYDILWREARLTEELQEERATVLLGHQQGNDFFVDEAMVHTELARNALVRLKRVREKKSVIFLLYFDEERIRAYCAEYISAGRKIIFAHSHPSYNREPSSLDYLASFGIREVGVVFSYMEEGLVVIAFKGKSEIEVVWS